MVIVCNLTPTPHHNYWVGVPEAGIYQELLNSDAVAYGGTGVGNWGEKATQPWRENDRWDEALPLSLPPLGVVILKLQAKA